MRKRAICLILAAVMIFGICGVPAFADISDVQKKFDELGEKISNITVGDAIRGLAELTGFEDVHHVISADGSPVTLTADPLSVSGFKLLKALGSYKTEYQWYRYDKTEKDSVRIEGATGTQISSEAMDEPGVNLYFYKVKIYQKSLLSYRLKQTVYSIPYIVGYTGMPTVYVNTPDEKYISSKTEWIQDSDIRIVGGPNCDYNLDTTAIRIKGRGNLSWRSTSKNGYTFKFDKKQDLFGIGKDKTWALVANYADKSLMRNWLAAELDKNVFDDGSEWNVTQRHVELVLNGEYRGSYTLATTIRIGDNRVDVPDISEELTKDKNKDGVIDLYDGGFVLELNSSLDEAYNFTTAKGMPFSLSDPDLDEYADKNEEIYQHVKNIVQTAENALYSKDFTNPETGYAKYIDVDSFLDHYLLQELAKNCDANSRSVYIYYQPKDMKLHVASSWDFDIAFGANLAHDCDQPEGLWCNQNWYARMLEDPAFVEKLVERWNECRPMIEKTLKKDLQQQADTIRQSANMNFMKWPILGLYVDRSPRDFFTRWTYQAEVDYLMNWTLERVRWLDKTFNDMI